ncbi:hypothetical protein, partial [Rivihabitans pingtungensis]|uniref:hypothetical protein n=1 Tax=Rivihabitans pingtungensis TaxID=1054498 RepID=UPI00289C3E0E
MHEAQFGRAVVVLQQALLGVVMVQGGGRQRLAGVDVSCGGNKKATIGLSSLFLFTSVGYCMAIAINSPPHTRQPPLRIPRHALL